LELAKKWTENQSSIFISMKEKSGLLQVSISTWNVTPGWTSVYRRLSAREARHLSKVEEVNFDVDGGKKVTFSDLAWLSKNIRSQAASSAMTHCDVQAFTVPLPASRTEEH